MNNNLLSIHRQSKNKAAWLIVGVFLLGLILSGCDLLFPSTYTVIFDSRGGSYIATVEEVREGRLVPEPIDPVLEGYHFDGWYADSALTTLWDFTADTVTEATTLSAGWTANDDTSYIVEHWQQDVSGSGYTKVTADTESLSGTTDTTATATAKNYAGFSENTEHYDRVASGTIAGDGSLVLKLYYDRDTFTVSFESNGGSSVSDMTGVRYNATIWVPVTAST